MRITSHTFKGVNSNGEYTYEITVSESFQHTVRMDAMMKGIKRFDRWRNFWQFVNSFAVLFRIKPLAKYSYQRF